ncbi:MAG TPA: hypothetical protein VK638_27870 [Edaphobacter sp.]|nr:hypothetical protein [Edaphobacter sp.]
MLLGYCSSDGLLTFQAKDLCDAYPELTTKVPGTIPPSSNSMQFSIAMTNFKIILAGMVYEKKSTFDGSLGIVYDIATQEAWHRAAFEADNAQRELDGDAIKKADSALFRTDGRSVIRYLDNAASKSVEDGR